MTGKKNKDTAKSDHQEVLDKIVQAAFEKTSEQGWKHLSLSDIASALDMPLSDLRLYIENKTDIIAIYNKNLDSKVLANLAEMDLISEIPVKDRLFDIMMERFDLMNQDRDALSNIVRTLNPDPINMLENCMRLKNSLTWMLEAAGLDTNGVKGKVRVKGLAVIYLVTLKTWLEDDSPDLSSTMARLDKLLKQAEQAANTFRMGDRDNNASDTPITAE